MFEIDKRIVECLTFFFGFFFTAVVYKLEIPAWRVSLGADAQLLGTSLVVARMPLSIFLIPLLLK